ncbi:hypothetical protein [Porphyromonas endodontalis]|uniref:hypothetical protein n=1 Tax=Porphyromonas endodontalis TaxID=28124 RepID=UPI003F9F1B46
MQNDKKIKNFFTRKGKGNRLISSRDTGQKLFIFQAAEKYFIACNGNRFQAKKKMDKGSLPKRSPLLLSYRKGGGTSETL